MLRLSLNAPALFAAAWLAGCSAANEVPVANVDREVTAPDAPLPASFATDQQADLAPCPGINPDIRRPAGSNCLGFVSATCGADRVASLVGQKDSPALRQDIMRRAGHDRIRWIGAREAVTADARPDRLNIEFDTARRVAAADCY